MSAVTFHTAPAGWHAIVQEHLGDSDEIVVVPLVGWLVEITPGGVDRDPTVFGHPVVLEPSGPPTFAVSEGSAGLTELVIEVVPPDGDVDGALAEAKAAATRERRPHEESAAHDRHHADQVTDDGT